MNQLLKTLPDDRPITSICVVENIEKCPKGYTAIARTHDQDSDADLWRESGFFGRKCTRYICISKTEGAPGQIVQCIAIFGEKESPPSGFNTVSKTFDTAQKAWRKRQLCYKLGYKYSMFSNNVTVVTDIIILSRDKKAPEEFTRCGEINGLLLCYKLGTSTANAPITTNIPYGISPDYQNISLPSSNASPVNNNSTNNNDYELLLPARSESTPQLPTRHNRPAPKPPKMAPQNYATISSYTGLDGVPFILNPKFRFANVPVNANLLVARPLSKMQIDSEFYYEFQIERQT